MADFSIVIRDEARKSFSEKDIARFESKFVKSGPGDCWEWLVGKGHAGYGYFKWNGGQRAHRFSYLLYIGPITEGLYVCHLCDNRGCVNPSHLFLGSHQENMNDMAVKGRSQRGVKHRSVKLTEAQVIEIRDRYDSGENYLAIAKQYNVSHRCVHAIAARERWKHV